VSTATSPRTVLITGAAGHLGGAVADAFAARGDRLVLLGRRRDAVAAVFADGPDRLLVGADLLDRAQLRGALDAAQARFGGVDVLCHLAGGFRMGEAVHETSDATWSALFDLNVRSFVNAAQEVVPRLRARGGGRIVAVGALAALKGTAGMGAYVASKSALVRLVESMAAELRDQGINVNCVLPSVIDTPDNRAAMPDADPSRWVAPAALADVIVFLASDAARAMHGAAVPVAGRV
jgi:NAD(P)-dependent dehydrogenase (short-subunit alcohol dehydrogenase family)